MPKYAKARSITAVPIIAKPINTPLPPVSGKVDFLFSIGIGSFGSPSFVKV